MMCSNEFLLRAPHLLISPSPYLIRYALYTFTLAE
jgi:hypothetical protein